MRLSTWLRISNRISRQAEAEAVESSEPIMAGEGTEGEADQEGVSVVEGEEGGDDEAADGDGTSESASR